jgi:hypothetical protein
MRDYQMTLTDEQDFTGFGNARIVPELSEGTGSNARLLSSELATLLTGCYIETSMLPFSFEGYCQFARLAPDSPNLSIDAGLANYYKCETDQYDHKTLKVLPRKMKKQSFQRNRSQLRFFSTFFI